MENYEALSGEENIYCLNWTWVHLKFIAWIELKCTFLMMNPFTLHLYIFCVSYNSPGWLALLG